MSSHNVVLACFVALILAVVCLSFSGGVPDPRDPVEDQFWSPRANVTVEGGAYSIMGSLTVNDCASQCLQKDACVSFVFLENSGQCSLFEYSMYYTVVNFTGGGTSWYYVRIPVLNDEPVGKAVTYSLEVPTTGVTLTEGSLLRLVFDNNINYLLHNWNLDDLLYPYRQRANYTPNPGQAVGWDTWLPGSGLGLLLMGAAGASRWTTDLEINNRVKDAVQGVLDCRADDGFIMAFEESAITWRENPDYVQSWVTHGLLEAYTSGNTDALSLLRSHWDWFAQCPNIPEIYPPDPSLPAPPPDSGTGHKLYLIYQGIIPHTRLGLSPVGQQEDIEIVQTLYEERWWLKQLAAHNLSAIWQRQYPHNYELTALEAYMDMYILTGDNLYIQAVLGAVEMFRDHWVHVGGSMAINEDISNVRYYPPDTYYIFTGHNNLPTGELCGSVFWIKLHQRLHLLFPDEESFVFEMERTLFNSGIANQPMDHYHLGIRYYSTLHKEKDSPNNELTCCEGQGTRLYGSLPEYLYTIDRRTESPGIYFDIYSASTFIATISSKEVKFQCITDFPYSGDVEITVSTILSTQFSINLRIPTWVSSTVVIYLDGNTIQSADPGTYAKITRAWTTSTITFTLGMAFSAHFYSGYNQIGSYQRWAYKYGPVLLAATGTWTYELDCLIVPVDRSIATNPQAWMIPVEGVPLHFRTADSTIEFLPYFEVGDQLFTVYPIIGNQTDPTCSTVIADDVSSAQLSCPTNGTTIQKVLFASYGMPQGNCASGLSTGDCHSHRSKQVAESHCLGLSSCQVPSLAALYLPDPCEGIPKTLAVQVQCG